MNASAVFKTVDQDHPDEGDGISMASSEGGFFGRVQETTMMGSSPSPVPPDASLYPSMRGSWCSGGAAASDDSSSDDDADGQDGQAAVVEELETDLTDQPQMKFLYEGWLTKLGYGSGKWQRRWFQLRGAEAEAERPRKASDLLGLRNQANEECAVLTYSRTPLNNVLYQVRGKVLVKNGSSCKPATAGSQVAASALKPGVVPRTPIPEHCIAISPPPGADVRATRVYYVAADDKAECDRWITWITISQSGRETPDPVERTTQTAPARAAYGLAAQLAQQELDDSAYDAEATATATATATTAATATATATASMPAVSQPLPPPPQVDGLLSMLFSDPKEGSNDSTAVGRPSPWSPDAGMLNAASARSESGASGASFEPVSGESAEHLFELIEDEFGPAGKEAQSSAPQASPALKDPESRTIN